MENQLIESTPSDSATLAFDKLRREVTTLRLAIERMTDEPEKIVIPDYTDTLAGMERRAGSLAKSYAALCETPALATTPDQIAQKILAAGANARAQDHAALDRAIKAFDQSERAITSALASARTAQEQDKRLKRVSLNCTIAGMVIWAIFPGIVIRATPENWNLPERIAAWSIGGDPWDAGSRIMEVSDPQRSKLVHEASQLASENRQILERCAGLAEKRQGAVTCAVVLRPKTRNLQ
jgi:hypothetical protein